MTGTEFDAIAEYDVVRRLGAGGMGEVFLVQHPRLPRRDALKLLDASVSRNPDFQARFAREADLLAPLSHPNIVHVYDRGELADGRLWLTMQYVDGQDASEMLRHNGPMPLPMVVDVIGGVGGALDYANSEFGLTHRDVKPANILIRMRDGRPAEVKLADFGIAKALGETAALTVTGLAVGTVSYMAPEAIAGSRIDHRADVYSLGCTAFELLTGAPPFTGENLPAMMMAHLNSPIPEITDRNPSLPPALNAVFERVLAKDPDMRFQSSGEFVDGLRGALQNGHVVGHAPATGPQYAQTQMAAPQTTPAPMPAALPTAPAVASRQPGKVVASTSGRGTSTTVRGVVDRLSEQIRSAPSWMVGALIVALASWAYAQTVHGYGFYPGVMIAYGEAFTYLGNTVSTLIYFVGLLGAAALVALSAQPSTRPAKWPIRVAAAAVVVELIAIILGEKFPDWIAGYPSWAVCFGFIAWCLGHYRSLFALAPVILIVGYAVYLGRLPELSFFEVDSYYDNPVFNYGLAYPLLAVVCCWLAHFIDKAVARRAELSA